MLLPRTLFVLAEFPVYDIARFKIWERLRKEKIMSRYTTKVSYYDDFHCIGGECSFTCCKEWKISVDEDTQKTWMRKRIPAGTPADCLPKHVSPSAPLHSLLTSLDGQTIIELNDTMCCPMLNQDRLCRVVLSYGEDCLSETCHIFPREIHHFKNRTEYALVSCCPAVIDFWHNASSVHFIGDAPDPEEEDAELRALRDLCLSVFSSGKYENAILLQTAFYILHDIHDRKNAAAAPSISDYKDAAFLQKLQDTLANLPESPLDSLIEQNELFLDITENYRAEHRYHTYLDPLCKEAESLTEKAPELPELGAFRKIISPYTTLLRNYLIAEGFTSLLIPDTEFQDMLMMLQWMAIEYAMIHHAVYLWWRIQGKPSEIRYEDVRDRMVLMSRITGYDQADIEDYLCECFEDPVWDFGYFQLLCGNL